MTLSDLHVHSPMASIFKCYFSHSRAAVDKISAGLGASRGPSATAALLVSCRAVYAVLVAVDYCDNANLYYY